MAFDSIFQGPPEAETAPGTAQSPSLGVDVVNKELYISAGEGWEELSVSGGSGNLSGTLTPGVMPIASASHTLADGTIDFGVTSPGTLVVQVADPTDSIFIGDFTDSKGIYMSPVSASLGLILTALIMGVVVGSGGLLIGSGGDVLIDCSTDFGGDNSLQLVAGGGITMDNVPSAPFGAMNRLSNTDTGGTLIYDDGGGGITVQDGATVPLGVTIGPLTGTTLLYSAAGTPLPAAVSVAAGTEATVSDATTPTYMGAYVSGGAVVVKVISDGATNWFTH